MRGLAVLALAAPVFAQPAEADLLARQQEQLRRLESFVAEVGQRVERLRRALAEAERRNREQAREIERLQARLAERDAADRWPRQRREFFSLLAGRLPLSPVYSIREDRIVVSADLVFVFSRGLIGAEGRERLAPLAEALVEALDALPPGMRWRLRVEGHTDRRPLRGNAEFPTNWELSAARATEMVRYLLDRGVPPERLEAVGLADTRPLVDERNRAAYRRNRRIELHLVRPTD